MIISKASEGVTVKLETGFGGEETPCLLNVDENVMGSISVNY